MTASPTVGVRHHAGSARLILGWVVIGAVASFVCAILLLHALRPDVSPVARVTSEYAVGPYGLLMTGAYFLLGTALLALALGLARSLAAPIGSTAGLALLVLAAVATGTAGLFPVDVGAPRPVTATGWVHRISAIVAFASMTLGPLLLVPRFRERPRWRDLAWIGGAVGVAGLAGLVAIQAFLLERELAGAAQRIVLALVVTWMLVVARRMVREGSGGFPENGTAPRSS